MFELNGKMFSLQDLQAEADKQGLTLEDYVKKMGYKKVSDKEEPKRDHISRNEFDYSGGSDV